MQLLSRRTLFEQARLRSIMLGHFPEIGMRQMGQDDNRDPRVTSIWNQFQQDMETGFRHIQIEQHTINGALSAQFKAGLCIGRFKHGIVERGTAESFGPVLQIFLLSSMRTMVLDGELGWTELGVICQCTFLACPSVVSDFQRGRFLQLRDLLSRGGGTYREDQGRRGTLSRR